MINPQPPHPRRKLNRRSFLRGAAGVSVALPFLEGLPGRSAWAADEQPTFSLFMCAAGGVVPEKFFPNAHGPLTTEGLTSAGKATSQLARHAARLLFVSGIDYPPSLADVHREGLVMSLTGRAAYSDSEHGDCGQPTPCLLAGGRSADWEVCARAAEPGAEPLVLYYGQRGFTSELLSWSAPATRAPAILNPYDVYRRLIGLLDADGQATPEGSDASELLLTSRKSVHDIVREELRALMKHPRLSSADHERLQQHFDSIRDAEVSFGGMGNEAAERCAAEGLDVTRLQALQNFAWDSRRTEEIIQLHLSLVALAFACNYTRSASLQWGDAYDHSRYAVPSNARDWNLTEISHRLQSDSATGDDPLAAQAHAEIDAVRMNTLAAGLDHFEARGLGDRCVVMWTNQYTNGPYHSPKDVPHIVWGSPGGYLKQGAYVGAESSGNNRLLNAVLTAALHGTGQTVEDFGEGIGGPLEVALA
ncbi:MAG: DUF1552 domain-containing protein [Myxococcales bacterium]|nr:MAG: DUF1552 domain-containing protein [Myxococcales bacterium]